MQIKFMRSGGFTGMQMNYEINTDAVTTEEAGEWERLVDEAGFFGLPGAILPSMAGADRFKYVIAVTRGTQQHRVETADGAVPESLQPLLQRLVAAARPKRV
jgi:emfourin